MGKHYSHLEVQDASICGNILQKIRTDQRTTSSIPVYDTQSSPPDERGKNWVLKPRAPQETQFWIIIILIQRWCLTLPRRAWFSHNKKMVLRCFSLNEKKFQLYSNMIQHSQKKYIITWPLNRIGESGETNITSKVATSKFYQEPSS